jgi:trimeric autotransporter adhesin
MLDATGNAEFPLHYFGAGTHTVAASYWGDNSYNPSTSASVTFTVLKAGTITSVTTNVNSIYSGSVVVTASVRPSVASSIGQLPNGTVTFTDKTTGAVLETTGGLNTIQDPSTGAYYGTIAIEVPVSQLTLGSNGIVATYNGDANYTASAASAAAVVACAAGCGNGTGQTIALSFNASTAATATSNGGSMSTTPVLVTPGGGFTGDVKLTCSVTGTNPSDINIPKCSFNPGTVTITNTQAVQSALAVTTTAAGTIDAADASRSGIWSAVRGGTMLACVLIFGIPSGRRRSFAALRVVLCAVALGAAMGGTTGCGGSGSMGSTTTTTTNAATGTTPDTYTVTFRAVDAKTGTLTAQDYFTISVN